jgi:DNA-binding MarR family transcriptional regulator
MELDKLVHQPTRLQIFAYLYRHGEAAFPTLVDELDVTEGNLSSHLQKMEEAGAVAVEKEFVDRKPQTTYELTPDGHALFEDHIDTLEALIDGLAED